MKKYLVFLSAFVFQYCETSTNAIINSYSTYTVNTVDKYEFPAGDYYSFRFDSLYQTIDPLQEIARLRNKGIIVEQAWYRSSLNGCSPPGATWTTTTMYGAVFLVQLENPNDKILDEKYLKLPAEPAISCGYYVSTYKLNR